MVSTEIIEDIAAPLQPVGSVAVRARGEKPEISAWQLGIYALPSIPIAFLYLPVAMMLPAFYARTLHVDLAAIGGFLLVSRILDVVLDPMIGKWSDTSHARIGRRKLWMLMGTPLLMLGAFILFMPLMPVNGWYLLPASFIIYAGGSMVGIPYSAWGMEIFDTYSGRATLAGYREAAAVFGGLLAAMIPAITGHFGHSVDRFTMGVMGWAIIVMTPLTVLIAVWLVKEPPLYKQARAPLRATIVALLENKPFRLVCATYVLFSIGGSIGATTMLFYIADYLKRPDVIGPSIFIIAIAVVAGVPLWLQISRRIGKHRAISCSLLLVLLIFGSFALWLKPGDGWLYVILLGVVGLVSSGYMTLPIGIIGDIIDYDTLKHKIARGGLFMGVWSFAQKISPALGIGLTLPLLKYLGYNPGHHNTPAGLQAIRYIYCLGSIPFLAAGAILLLFFSIDARRHGIIRKRLDQRFARAARDAK